jgi:hypothetical protein
MDRIKHNKYIKHELELKKKRQKVDNFETERDKVLKNYQLRKRKPEE